jgi:hypothetical protein
MPAAGTDYLDARRRVDPSSTARAEVVELDALSL